MKTFAIVTAFGIAALALPARAETGAVVAGKFGDWTVHQSTGEGAKICFTTSEPKTKEPAGANRGTILAYVSAWPKDGVKGEPSFRVGYSIKTGSMGTVAVGNDKFALFGREDRAYVADATEELKLLEAMKKGQKLIVQATSERGTTTTDTYSLQGFVQAMQAVAACS